MGKTRSEANSSHEELLTIRLTLKELYEVTGVKMKMLAEMKGGNVLQRWDCRRHVFRHPTFWDTPNSVMEHGEAGSSGCPLCRELEREESVSFEDLASGAREQEKREEKSMKKSRGKSRRNFGAKYVV